MASVGSVAQAEALLASGAEQDAVAIVGRAADAGDVDALMRLATWRLIGAPLSRDLPLARTLLARAVAIGHVDAALMEIALTANGSGGASNWPEALRMLRVAAIDDPVAMRQLTLLDAMDLRPDGAPARLSKIEKLSESPAVSKICGFLTPAECAHIAEAAKPVLEPADVIDSTTGRRIAHPVRTSHGGAIGPTREDLVIRAINHRLAAVSGTKIEQGEPLTVLYYGPGQQYRPHVDTLARTDNQRIKTVLIYLNQGYGGGETRFLANGLTIRPVAGDAIMFDNVLPNGMPDIRSRHAGLPVTAGSKWLATRWIRTSPYDPWVS